MLILFDNTICITIFDTFRIDDYSSMLQQKTEIESRHININIYYKIVYVLTGTAITPGGNSYRLRFGRVKTALRD